MTAVDYFDRVYVDSRLRNTGTTTDFSIYLPQKFRARNVYLHEINFVNTLNNVSAGSILRIVEDRPGDDEVYDITIDPGHYDEDQLAAAVQAKIRSETLMSNATVTYDADTMKYTINYDPTGTQAWQVQVVPQSNPTMTVNTSLGVMMGFSANTAMNGSAKTGDKRADLVVHKYVYLACPDLVISSMTKQGAYGILYKIPLRVGYFYDQYEEPVVKHLTPIQDRDFSGLSFRLLDMNMNPIPADQFYDFNFTLCFE